MRRFLSLVTCLTALFASTAFPCSFAPGYRTFELNPRAIPLSGNEPSAPVAQVASLKRGFDDGNFASCSDAAVLTIQLADGESDRNIGYLFSIESGSLHETKMPDEIIAPIELENGQLGFFFVWLDYGTGFSAMLKIQAVSKTGLEGDAISVEVKDK